MAGGEAQIQSSEFDAGTRPITARFVPEDPSAYAGSTSPAVDLSVTGPKHTPTPTPTPSPAPTPTQPPDCVDVVLDVGDVDIAARSANGTLRTEVKDATLGGDQVVWRDSATVAFHIKPAARTAVPDDPRFRFLGPGRVPDTFALSAGQHLHANWCSRPPARYTILGRVTGVLAATGQRVTDLEPYGFTVNG